MKNLVYIIIAIVTAFIGSIYLPSNWVRKTVLYISKTKFRIVFFIMAILFSAISYSKRHDIAMFLSKKNDCYYKLDEFRQNYSNCIFSGKSTFWSDVEGKNFNDSKGIPKWVANGLNEEGFYSQKTLIYSIKNGFKDLEWADLNKADLKYINLESVNLSNAKLDGANLTGANINNAVCVNTSFVYAIWIDGKTCQFGSTGRCIINEGDQKLCQ